MSTDNYRSAALAEQRRAAPTQALDLNPRSYRHPDTGARLERGWDRDLETGPEPGLERDLGGDLMEEGGPAVDERGAPPRHVVDRLDGALGLFLLRLAVAAIMGVRGLQKLQSLPTTEQQLAQLAIPNPATMSVVLAGAEVAIGLALVLGLAVRLAGLGITVITVGALALVQWRSGDVFTAGQPGFTGELELLLAAVGLALLGLGGGGWALDRRFRRPRRREGR